MKKFDDEGMSFDNSKQKDFDQNQTPDIKVAKDMTDSAIDVESINLTDEGDGSENFRSGDAMGPNQNILAINADPAMIRDENQMQVAPYNNGQPHDMVVAYNGDDAQQNQVVQYGNFAPDKDAGFESPDKKMRASHLSGKSPQTANKLINNNNENAQIQSFYEGIEDEKPKKIGAISGEGDQVGGSEVIKGGPEHYDVSIGVPV